MSTSSIFPLPAADESSSVTSALSQSAQSILSLKREREKQEKEAEPEMKEPATKKAKLEAPEPKKEVLQTPAEDVKQLDVLVSLLSSGRQAEVLKAVEGINEIWDKYKEHKEVLESAFLQHCKKPEIDVLSDSDDDYHDFLSMYKKGYF